MPGDIVDDPGKGHEQGQDIGGVVEPFDDRTVVEECSARLIALTAGELAGTRLLSGDPATRIESVVTDCAPPDPARCSARSEGERSDGHAFLDEVRAAGAVAVLCRSRAFAAARGRVRAGG